MSSVMPKKDQTEALDKEKKAVHKGKKKQKETVTASSSVSVEVKQTQGKISLHISSSRPPSVIGSQGDHVSAYTLFKECIYSKCQDLDLQEAIKLLLYIIDQYTEEEQAQTIFEQAKAQMSSEHFLMDEEIEQIVDALKKASLNELAEKTKCEIEKGRSATFENILSNLIATHLTLRNKLELTAFPREGNVEPPKGEGARIKKATKNLKNLAGEKKPKIEKIVAAIKELFWFPEIPDYQLIKPNSANWKGILKKKKYNKDTIPRSNKPDILCQAIENHLNLVFSCYPSLHSFQRQIIDDFMDNILDEWRSLNKEQKKAVKLTINKNLSIKYAFKENRPSGSRKSLLSSLSSSPKEEKNITILDSVFSKDSPELSQEYLPPKDKSDDSAENSPFASEVEEADDDLLIGTDGDNRVTFEQSYKITSKSTKKSKKADSEDEMEIDNTDTSGIFSKSSV